MFVPAPRPPSSSQWSRSECGTVPYVKSTASIVTRRVRVVGQGGPAPSVRARDRDLPKSLSIVIGRWRKAAQDKLDAEDPHSTGSARSTA